MRSKNTFIALLTVALAGLCVWLLFRNKEPDYLAILKRAGKYSLTDHRPVPAFTYQPATAPQLVNLRKTYKLDSIAGKGYQLSQVINLMYWLHDRIPHNGNLDNPPQRNALSLLAICKKQHRTLNCRGLALVLNECYLAMGFKSRFVTCLPKDSLGTDDDCHNINIVYINSLKRWIWIDPTVAGYVKDENGQLLSPEEVRKRLVFSEPVDLNPDANWNHRKAKNNRNYLYTYMAKNLYRFECPVNSEFDLETKTPGKVISYMELFPLDYFRQKAINKVISIDKRSKVTYVDYVTSNPGIFWAAPVE